MKQGDFTALAKAYVNRPGYSDTALRCLAAYVGALRPGFQVADVGAGTGKLTECLIAIGLGGHAVEPNDAMRAEGTQALSDRPRFRWHAGFAEETGLPDDSVDWVLMASSFHWTDHERSLAEFKRILRPGGYFTALWNPRDLESSELQMQIEQRVQDRVPELKRVSSGARKYTLGLEEKLSWGGLFGDLVFLEAPHEVVMSKARYLGSWRSVNDIQSQAGPERFQQILADIEEEISELDEVPVPYRTRAWTVRSLD